MSAMPKPRKLTVHDYLTIEKLANWKSEFFNGEMFAIAGASREHNAVTRNLTIELGNRLRGSSCEVYVADQRVKIDKTGLYTYPGLIGRRS